MGVARLLIIQNITDTVSAGMHAGGAVRIPDSVSVSPASDLWTALRMNSAALDRPMASAEEIFGPLSRLVHSGQNEAANDVFTPFLTGNIWFSAAVLVCFLAACLIIYLYRDHVFSIFNVLRGGNMTEKMLGEQSNVFSAFLHWSMSLGFLMGGLAVIRLADIYAGGQIAEVMNPQLIPLLIPAAWAACALVWGYQYVFLKAAGGLTQQSGFTDRLLYFKKILISLCTIATLPVFLFFVLSDGAAGRILGITLATLVALTSIFLIIRTFMLFIRQNLSILLWILYLCAVEIFPVSLMVLVAVKMLE